MVTGRSAVRVARHLDEVFVGVAEIDRADGAGGAAALDRSQLDGDAAGGQVRHHRFRRRLGDEA